MDPVQQPAWSGLTLDIGTERHILPLYEDERIHSTSSDCPCKPDCADLMTPGRHEPDRQIYTHHSITGNKQ